MKQPIGEGFADKCPNFRWRQLILVGTFLKYRIFLSNIANMSQSDVTLSPQPS